MNNVHTWDSVFVLVWTGFFLTAGEDGNYTRMLRAILNKSWQQHPTRHQLYGHLPPITKTIQVRRTRHAGHCWRSRDELIRDVLLWIPTHGRAKAGRPARTYIQQLCEDTGYCPEDLPRAMNDREEWRERVRDIRAASTIWWWWWWWWWSLISSSLSVHSDASIRISQPQIRARMTKSIVRYHSSQYTPISLLLQIMKSPSRPSHHLDRRLFLSSAGSKW